MKTFTATAFLLLMLFGGSTLSANDYGEKSTAFAHLSEVNVQWLKHTEDAPAAQVFFASDIDRIQYHLVLVEKHLRKNTPSGFSSDALKNREHLLDELKEYAAAKVFPSNTYHSERTPYFIDNYGTYCAVGYLVSVSGHDKLARKINHEHRFDYIRDIKTDGLTEWAASHGFTVDELAWIQPGYNPPTKFLPLGTGTNGPIGGMAADQAGKRVLFYGSFTEVNDLPCSNIGHYSEGQLGCLGGGIEGTINDIASTYNNEVAVSGSISHNGNTYPLAIYDGQNWEYISIPDRSGATGGAVIAIGSIIEIALTQESVPGLEEVWIRETNTWRKKLAVEGKIYDMAMGPGSMAYGGVFGSATIYKQFSSPETIEARNVLYYESMGQKWKGLGAEVSDTVRVVKLIGNAYFFAGACSNAEGRSDVCLTRYLNGTFQHLINAEKFSEHEGSSTIHSIDVYDDKYLLIGGDFNIDPMIGVNAKNLISYDLVNSYAIPLGLLDGTVTGVAGYNNTGLFGGNFSKSMGDVQQDMNYLAMIDMPAFIAELTKGNISLYPNPAQSHITINAGNNTRVKNLNVTDVVGRTMMREVSLNMSGPKTLDISTLKPGMYVLTVETAGNERLQKTFSVR